MVSNSRENFWGGGSVLRSLKGVEPIPERESSSTEAPSDLLRAESHVHGTISLETPATGQATSVIGHSKGSDRIS